MIYYEPDDGTVVVEHTILKNRHDALKLISDVEKNMRRYLVNEKVTERKNVRKHIYFKDEEE